MDRDEVNQKICLSICYFICLYPLIVFGCSVIVLIAMLFTEISCFSILALLLWHWCTKQRWDYTDKDVEKALKVIHRFISNARHKNNDRIIRILAVNYGYHKVQAQDGDRKLGEWIDQQNEQQRLHEVTYKEIRHHCSYQERANLFKQIWEVYAGKCDEERNNAVHYGTRICSDCSPEYFYEAVPASLFLILAICSFP